MVKRNQTAGLANVDQRTQNDPAHEQVIEKPVKGRKTDTKSGSQRTSGRIPKRGEKEKGKEKEAGNAEDGEPERQQPHPERQGVQQEERGKDDPRKSTNTSAYDRRPNPDQQHVCLDVTSHRFIPEDDQRIAIMLRKMVGDDEDGRKKSQEGDSELIIHDFPTVVSSDVTGTPLDQAPGAAQTYEADDSKFISVVDFATVERPDASVYHTITRRDTTTFLLVYRPENARGKRRWEVPPLTFCQDYINDLLSKLFAEDAPAAGAYARTGKWGLVQTIVLHTTNLDTLSDFRRNVTAWNYKGYSFDTFPRDVVVAKADVTVLLRASMKTFKTEIIPKVLFTRNSELIAGTLRVVSTKFFTAEQKSHKGESKEYWRSIELKGNHQFMRCLRFIPENRPFLLGYDAVQIRGGLRPQEIAPMASGSKRPWSDFHFSDTPLLMDPRTDKNNPPFHNSNEQQFGGRGERGGKRGRPYRGSRRGRGRFPWKK